MHRPYFQHQPKTKDGHRKVSPSGPSYMSDNQVANYLNDLRTNRPSRPGGSRPVPIKSSFRSPSNPRDDLPPRATSAMSTYSSHTRPPSVTPAEEIERPRATSALSNHRPMSSRGSVGSSAGRPLVQEPRTIPVRRHVSPTRMFARPSPPSPNAAYRESNQRRYEKEEARSLRDALQEMDVNDEVRVFDAAQDEATELVWAHQNPGVPYKNPYAPYRNPDMQKPRQESGENSVAQSQSLRSPFARRNSRRPTSEIFSRSVNGRVEGSSPSPTKTEQQPAGDEARGSPRKNSIFRRSLKVDFALPREEDSSKPTGANPGLGLVDASNDSPSKSPSKNPRSSIYEEPAKQDDERPDFSKSDSSGLRNQPRTGLPRGARPLPGRLSSLPFADKLSRFEIHRNPPSQSRNAEYKTNSSSPPKPHIEKEEAETESPSTKDGLEIRSDDIRAATSKKFTDRSTKLPMPSAVSDRAGRPIVSFDQKWKPTEAESPRKPAPPPAPAPAAPSIEVSEPPPIPVINVPDEKEPTISEIASSADKFAKGNKPAIPPQSSQRTNPSSSPTKPQPATQNRWLSTYSRSGVPTASCEACTLPISGKIVTAGGARFHPECFMCHHCHTPLECVAFYQEPAAKRNDRLAGVDPHDEEAFSLRFYCALDFHELFSPRCKSCKTPIEGEVVVACGAEWHVGHFFCAECGDPFSHDKPFVEKDGFAWCLQCHSKRTAPRCLACKKPVMEDVVITAVGGQWHDECFKCHECGEGFGADGRYFVREGEPRRTAKGRIIGGPVQLAVCERCEGLRLKASPRQ